MIVKRVVVGIMKENCYILFDDISGYAAVVDPGENGEKILQEMKNIGIKLNNVKYIFLTHSHFDHICALADLKNATDAKVVIHDAEKNCLSKEYVCNFYPPVRNRYKECYADITIKGGEVFTFGNISAKFIHTPGHTVGSCVIEVGNCLFTGDTLMKESCGRCDLPTGNQDDIINSLKLLGSISGNKKIYPGHSEETSLDYERMHNLYIKEALAL